MLATLAACAGGDFLCRGTPFAPRPGPFIALFGGGFLLALVGHIVHSKIAVVAGIVLIFGATLLLPIALYLSSR